MPTLKLGTRVYACSALTTARQTFVNSNYEIVICRDINEALRDALTSPKLLLVRSLRESFQQHWTSDEWDTIDGTEIMWAHKDADDTQRIMTTFGTWLMNPHDRDDGSWPPTTNWVNYFAWKVRPKVDQTDPDYDGAFIDGQPHILPTWVVCGSENMPHDYSDSTWHASVVTNLDIVKTYFSTRLVIYNGLHVYNDSYDSDASIANTDGAMWEIFAYSADKTYRGKADWLKAIEYADTYKSTKYLALTAKINGITSDIDMRKFITASYYLVSGDKTIFTILDLDDYQVLGNTIFYYPEYGADIGTPSGDYTVNAQGIYVRDFTNGKILVDPTPKTPPYAMTVVSLGGNYQEVIPSGGGLVDEDGAHGGSLSLGSQVSSISIGQEGGKIMRKVT